MLGGVVSDVEVESLLGGVRTEGEGSTLDGAEEREAGSGSEVSGERPDEFESAGYLELSLVEDVSLV